MAGAGLAHADRLCFIGNREFRSGGTPAPGSVITLLVSSRPMDRRIRLVGTSSAVPATGGAGDGARMLDQGFHAAQDSARVNTSVAPAGLLGCFETGGDLDGDHAAETAVHLACRDVVARLDRSPGYHTRSHSRGSSHWATSWRRGARAHCRSRVLRPSDSCSSG